MTTTELRLSAAFDLGLVPSCGGSVRHLLCRLSAVGAEAERDRRKPLNLALVIDASGSMAGGRLEAAKRAALGVLDRLGPGDRLSVVSFASDVEVHLDGVAIDAGARQLARREIGRLDTRGMTNLSEGWFTGAECAARVQDAAPGLMPRVIILSDGHANEGITGRGDLAEHAAELRARGVITSALGIGDGYDEELLAALAENGGGRMHDAELDAEIETVLLGELGEAAATLVEDATLALDLPACVRAEPFGSQNFRQRGNRLTVPLGAIVAGGTRVLAIRLHCPPGEEGARLDLTLGATGRDARTGQTLEAASVALRLRVVDPLAAEMRGHDTEVAVAVARAWQGHVLRRMAALNRERAHREAEAYLRDEIRRFASYVRGLEGTERLLRELELMQREVHEEWSPRVRKEMALHAAKLREGSVDHRGPAKAAWSAHMASRPR
ncbi:VWA domain-containing protein [Halovulum dunhuangense]|uniref:VWA domain-containing protein n=1 Tax=Halovulum dunhuangense TaxID=1505036 RepID=A0A849L7H2_9RHOB|nr:VWA domain-containing protein [Halovulum dunhuangense]NNU82072.1 VWA domain-containing protein [Halovulum dunhuangense]